MSYLVLLRLLCLLISASLSITDFYSGVDCVFQFWRRCSLRLPTASLISLLPFTIFCYEDGCVFWQRFSSIYLFLFECVIPAPLLVILVQIPCTCKRLVGKFYYFGILTVRRQIKNPRTSRKREFNFLFHCVLNFFVILLSADDTIIVILKD